MYGTSCAVIFPSISSLSYFPALRFRFGIFSHTYLPLVHYFAPIAPFSSYFAALSSSQSMSCYWLALLHGFCCDWPGHICLYLQALWFPLLETVMAPQRKCKDTTSAYFLGEELVIQWVYIRMTNISENEMNFRIPLSYVRLLNGMLKNSLEIFPKKTH